MRPRAGEEEGGQELERLTDKDCEQSVEDLVWHLDRVVAKRRKEEKRQRELHHVKVREKRNDQKRLDVMRGRTDESPWVTELVPSRKYFMDPATDRNDCDSSGTENDLTAGIYRKKEFKAPHGPEPSAWRPHVKNNRGETIGFFAAKPIQQQSRGERVFTKRLERELARHQAADERDRKKEIETRGSISRRLREQKSASAAAIPPHWVEQAVSTHEYFALPKPLTIGEGVYRTGLEAIILQPDRSTSHELDFVGGITSELSGRTSSWHPPKAGPKALTRLQAEAKALEEEGRGFRKLRRREQLPQPHVTITVPLPSPTIKLSSRSPVSAVK